MNEQPTTIILNLRDYTIQQKREPNVTSFFEVPNAVHCAQVIQVPLTDKQLHLSLYKYQTIK